MLDSTSRLLKAVVSHRWKSFCSDFCLFSSCPSLTVMEWVILTLQTYSRLLDDGAIPSQQLFLDSGAICSA